MTPNQTAHQHPVLPPARGFTVIELLVVIAIAAILLGIAAPSFQAIIQRNRVASETNAFVGDLQLARAEAIKEGQSITVCASSNGTSCTTGTGWQNGWLVFSDANGNGQIDASTDVVLKRQRAWTSTDTFVADNGNVAFTYSRDGFAVGMASGGSTWKLHTTPVNSAATQCVALSIVGRHQVQTPGTGNCT